MADNVTLDAGSGGDTIAADDVGGVKYQVVKLAVGADGAANLVANANPIPVSDAGGTLTVDGTVAVSGTVTVDGSGVTQPVSNAGLTELAAAINASSQVDVNLAASNATVAVSNAGLTELAAAINASSQLDVNVAGGTVAVTHAALTELAAAIDTEVQVDVVSSALPSGAATAANQTTIIGHVDGIEGLLTTIDADTGNIATAVQLLDDTVFAEDVAAQAGDKGIQVLAVRRDADTSLVGADNDYAPLQVNAAGSLKVAITAGAGSGGTSIADGATFTRDTTSVTLAAAAVESSAPTLTNGDAAALSMTTGGALRVAVASGGVSGKVDDAAFTAASDEGVLMMGVASSDSVDANDAGALAMTTARELKVSLTTALPAGTAAIGKLSANSGVDIGDVDVTSCALPTGAATSANQSTVITALQLIDDPVFADDAAYTLSTHKVSVAGGIAVETDGTDPTAVAEADAAALRTDRQRNLLVNITHPRFWHVSADYGAAQTNVSVKASPGASLSLYITDLVISNGATAGNITLLDGSGGTVLFELYPAINGGVSKEFRNPIKLTAATALCLTSTTVTTHSIFVSGYIAP